MAANNGGSNSTGKKFYYNVSFGMLMANAKEAPEGYTSTTLAEIKSKRSKNENVDLREKFYDSGNGKEYPLRVFYTDIDGIIESIEKDKYEKGTSLKITLHDGDGDESIIQTDFYGKVSADILNRLTNTPLQTELNFRPYSIPSKFTPDGGTEITYYNAGISVKNEGVKIERSFNKDNGLPATEQILDVKGENQTSRVAQINFLWEKVEAKYKNMAETPTAPEAGSPVETSDPKEEKHDDLPF